MRLLATRLLPVLALTALAAPVLAGCGGGDEEQDAAATTTGSAHEENPGTLPPRPAPGTCEPVAGSADGRYVVADAGEVLLRAGDGGLSANVSTSNGWGTSVTTSGDSADVEFRRGEEELQFEAELANGALVVRVCAGD